MDIQKIVIYIGLVLVGLMLWAEWQKEQSMPAPKANSTSSSIADKPTFSNKREPVGISGNQQGKPQVTHSAKDVITVTTDLLEVQISKDGGAIVDATLKNHYVDIDTKNNLKLFTLEPKELYLAESGFIADGAVVSDIKFMSSKSKYFLNGDKLEVVLTGLLSDTISVTKTYIFNRNKHSINIKTTMANNGSSGWVGQMYYQLVRKQKEAESGFMLGMSSYLGAAISDPNKKLYEKVSFDDMRKHQLLRTVESGWVVMQEHYFLSAFIPTEKTTNTFYSQEYGDNQFAIGYSTPAISIKSGGSHDFESTLYVGPEYSEELKALAPGLELTIDYGWLWFISSLLFSILKLINSYVQNWGWSIILLTVCIKLIFYRLSSASYRSMAGMKKFQPKLQALKEKYGDDKQKLNQAMMDIYKKEKINPLGGCLPILIQIPVFIALYWVLLESVELRHSPFILWINDLTSRDPYFILPILMGASMLVQQKLSPPPADPTQAKVMQFLPVIFTLLFISVPAGLVLYWTVNNVLSITQQWYITRNIERKSK